MSSVINVAFDLTDAEELIIPVDAWGFPVFSVLTDTGSGAALVVTVTGERINRGETPNWVTPVDLVGAAIGTIASDTMEIFRGPLEAVRLQVDGASGNVVGRLMQSGAE